MSEARRGEGRRAPESQGHPALTDPETGLPNELHFRTAFRYLVGAADRGIPLTLLVVQIDDHDELLERSGKEQAHDVAATAGRAMWNATRRGDLWAVFDGGRFAGVLMDANLQGGMLAAERIRSAVGEALAGTGTTVSVGLAGWKEDMKTGDDLFASAEHALDRSREQGGDTVEISR